MSAPEPGRAIVDAGLKASSVDSGLPTVHAMPGVTFVGASDDHGKLAIDAGIAGPSLGDKLMLIPGTDLHPPWKAGTFQLMESDAMLIELRQTISHLDALSHCIFRTNHASNYLPLAGTLPQDKDRLLAMLDKALAQGRSVLRPEAWRAL